MYSLDWLKTFDGNLAPSEIDMASLANTIEANVSQYRYFYNLSVTNFSKMIIEVRNSNIPHLLGLSKGHHLELPTYQPNIIFDRLKDKWTLEDLISSDNGWFSENQFKLVGVLLLYQIFNMQDCKAYTTEYIFNNLYVGKRFKRDNVYFVILKSANNTSYTMELAPVVKKVNTYFPRSLKINDDKFKNCAEVNLKFVRRERIKKKKRKNKG